MNNLDKQVKEDSLKALAKKAEQAGEMLHYEAVRQAMEVENPAIAALGLPDYWPRLAAYTFGLGYTLYKLDSKSEGEGQPIVYVPLLTSEVIDSKLYIKLESAAKTGAAGEEAFKRKRSEYNR